jgi:hypothetical protein
MYQGEKVFTWGSKKFQMHACAWSIPVIPACLESIFLPISNEMEGLRTSRNDTKKRESV